VLELEREGEGEGESLGPSLRRRRSSGSVGSGRAPAGAGAGNGAGSDNAGWRTPRPRPGSRPGCIPTPFEYGEVDEDDFRGYFDFDKAWWLGASHLSPTLPLPLPLPSGEYILLCSFFFYGFCDECELTSSSPPVFVRLLCVWTPASVPPATDVSAAVVVAFALCSVAEESAGRSGV
jgi:hypothetical protein